MYYWLSTKNNIPLFTYDNIQFGVKVKDKRIEFLVNNVNILGKLFIDMSFFEIEITFFVFFKLIQFIL